MELILLLSGLAFIVASFILAAKQQRDYLRVQEKMMENMVDAGVIELQSLASELTEQLVSLSEKLAADLRTQANSVQPSGQSQPDNASNEAPGQCEDAARPVPSEQPRTTERRTLDVKPPAAKGPWNEREKLVREMYSLGMDPEVIAKELNIGKGEVRLILDLARHEDNIE